MPKPDRSSVHEQNRRSWNHATRAHNSHKQDQARFFREGGSTLFSEERDLLGDLDGKTLAHLLCNAGQDTLSLAGLGASVTGVDISDEAIDFARQLSVDSGIEAQFERADVFDWLTAAQDRGQCFDVVFASYGALCWLSDCARFLGGVAAILNNGGRLVLMEFHPLAMIFDERMKLTYPYASQGEPCDDAGVGDYVAFSGTALAPSGYTEGVVGFENPEPAMDFAWGLADILGGVLGAGLTVERFEEYPYANGCQLFEEMSALPGNRWTLPDGRPEIPMMYGLVARKSLAAAR